MSTTKSLSGRRIAVTRAREQASELAGKLAALGADVIELPLIHVSKEIDKQTLADVLAELGSYDWIVFTSANGVRFFFEEFFRLFDDIRSLGFLRFAAVGETTAKAIDVVGVGGRIVQVGLGRLEATISTASLILRKVTLIGSQGGTKDDVEGVDRYFATGQLTPTISKITFDQIPEGIARLKRGEVVGRLAAPADLEA